MSEIPSREEALFTAALPLAGAARDVFLERACAGDAVLRHAVEALLRAHEAAGEFLEKSAVPPPNTDEAPGTRIGRYVLGNKLGEGGCGVVYEAEQQEPVRRSVALKIIKLGMDTKAVIARFEAERQALALMDHPNIAKVFDAGATETGRPYFVMELVRGQRITDYCDAHRLSVTDRLALFTHVCQALQHAHQKGVIHRDLKPSNILVATRDGAPAPVIIDFGIAKATQGRLAGDTTFTGFDQFIGTPAYMSPEQAEANGPDVDTRSDVYSLGALLYELLAGRPPFEPQPLLQTGLDEIRRTLREVDPPKPSLRPATLAETARTAIAQCRATAPAQLRAALRGDLDWIVMKALEKQPARRYETAGAFAADIARHLENQPVLACPPSAPYRLRKLIARHQLATAALGAIAAALVIGAGLFTWEYVREKTALRRALAAEQTQSRLAAQAEAARLEEARQRILAETAAHRAETSAARSDQTAILMKEMLRSAGPRAALGRDTKLLRDLLDETARRLSRDLSGQPEVEVELRETLATTYNDLGDYANAVTQRRRVLALRRAHWGAQYATVATAWNALGRALLAANGAAEAEACFREALALQQPHPDLDALGTMGLIATALNQQGNTSEAEALRREILARKQQARGDQNPAVTSAMGALGSQLSAQGRTTEAESLLRETVARRRTENPDRAATAVALSNLSVSLRADGKLFEAEQALRESIALWRQSRGDDTIEQAGTLISLATLLRQEGRLDEAESTFRSVLALQRKFLGSDHTDLTHTLRDLAELLASRERWTEAGALLREALAIAQARQLDADASLTLAQVDRLPAAREPKPDPEQTLRDAVTAARRLPQSGTPQLIAALSALREAVAQRGSSEANTLDLELAALRKSQMDGAPLTGPAAAPVAYRPGVSPIDSNTPPTVPTTARPQKPDTIQIVHVTPKRVTPGVPTTFSVWVKYSLRSLPDAKVTLGFNTLGANSYPIAASKLVNAGAEEIELTATVNPVQWPGGKPFSLLVTLAPDPRPPGAQSLAGDTYELEFQ